MAARTSRSCLYVYACVFGGPASIWASVTDEGFTSRDEFRLTGRIWFPWPFASDLACNCILPCTWSHMFSLACSNIHGNNIYYSTSVLFCNCARAHIRMRAHMHYLFSGLWIDHDIDIAIAIDRFNLYTYAYTRTRTYTYRFRFRIRIY